MYRQAYEVVALGVPRLLYTYAYNYTVTQDQYK